MFCVAICWCIDDDLKPFRLIFRDACLPAIKRANISGGIGGRTARPDVSKLGFVIVREKDIVMVKIKATGFGVCEPDQSGKRPRFCRHFARSAGCRRPQQARSQSRGVAVKNDFVSCQIFAAGKLNPGNRFVLNIDARNRRVIAEYHALLAGQLLQSRCKRAHPAFDGPYALRLDMRDKHQRSRRLKWR